MTTLRTKIENETFCDHIDGKPYWDKETLLELVEESEAKFEKALNLLEELSSLQNGLPLAKYEERWEKTMEEINQFLNDNEK